MINKKVIKISERNWQKLKSLNAGSMDKTLNIIMDFVEPEMPFIKYSDDKMKSVNIYEDTFNRLNSFKLSDTEAKETIVTRLLIAFEELNNTSTNEWISFKLTNPYNHLLTLSGQLEYNSRELSFNYRSNVYIGKLPPHYIVEGKDLTKELYLWYDNLDWNEIINHLLDNVDTQTIIDSKDYSLEINDVFSSY